MNLPGLMNLQGFYGPVWTSWDSKLKFEIMNSSICSKKKKKRKKMKRQKWFLITSTNLLPFQRYYMVHSIGKDRSPFHHRFDHIQKISSKNLLHALFGWNNRCFFSRNIIASLTTRLALREWGSRLSCGRTFFSFFFFLIFKI